MARVLLLSLAALVAFALCGVARAEETPAKKDRLTEIADSALDFMENPVIYDGTSVKVKLSVDFRLRLEHYSHGDNQLFGPAEHSDTLYLSRLTFGFHFEVGTIMSAAIEAIDARAGSYPDPVKPSRVEDEISLNRAFFVLHPEQIPLYFKFGRDYMKVSDGRLFGKADWDQVPWRFEQVGIGFKHKDNLHIDLAYVRPVFPDDGNFDQAHYRENTAIDEYQYGIAWGGYSFMPELSLDLFFISKIDDNELVVSEAGNIGDHRIYTYGARVFGKLYDFAYSVDGAFQGGNRSTDDIEAWSTEATIRYEPDVEMKPTLWFTYLYSSGDKNKLDGKYETFDPIFGDWNSRYSTIGPVAPSNTNMLAFGGSIDPIEDVTISAAFYHWRRIEMNDDWYGYDWNIYQSGSYLSGPFDSRTLGNEIDITIDYRFTKFTRITAGYASFFNSQMLNDQNKKKLADYFFLEFRLSF